MMKMFSSISCVYHKFTGISFTGFVFQCVQDLKCRAVSLRMQTLEYELLSQTHDDRPTDTPVVLAVTRNTYGKVRPLEMSP
jgi:hypothetical protein